MREVRAIGQLEMCVARRVGANPNFAVTCGAIVADDVELVRIRYGFTANAPLVALGDALSVGRRDASRNLAPTIFSRGRPRSSTSASFANTMTPSRITPSGRTPRSLASIAAKITMIQELERAYVCIHGAPTIARVDDVIFVCRYFTRCMSCTFCADQCCTHGVDVDIENVTRILARAAAIERVIGISRDAWFEPATTRDAEFPGGRSTRTRVRDGACVFRVRGGRGCALHAHALDAGFDYHDIKPMVSALFPITFDAGLLHAATEIEDGTLVCAGEGPTLYRGARAEIEHYFGASLLRELDTLEALLS